MSPEERTAKFRRFIEAWTQRNLATVEEVMAPDVVYHMPPFPDFQGTEPLRRFITEFRQAFPDDFQVAIEEDLASGEVTVHRWSVSGTYKGRSPLLPVMPTGKRTTATGCHICRWAGDRCVEVWHFGDWLGWLQKAGVMPSLDELVG